MQVLGTCNKTMHFIGTKANSSIHRRKKAWICESCCASEEESEESSGDEGDSSCEEVEEETLNTSHKNKKRGVAESSAGGSSESKLELIVEQNRQILKKLDRIERENKQLKDELKELKSENNKIRKEIDFLKTQREYYRQDTLKNNVVISGLPLKDNVDRNELNKFVIDIAKKLDVNISGKDITCYKVGKTEQKQLKVVFENADKKDLIMKNKRDLVLNTKHIGLSEDKIIYINHDMTIKNQLLFKKAREYKKEKAIKYAWYKDGKIFARQSDNSAIIRIKSDDDLLQFKKKLNKTNKIRILYLNIRSIRKKYKFENLLCYTKKFKYPHIIAITESWLKETETKFYNIDKYNAVHNCRKTRGGGTILYIRNDLKYETLELEKAERTNICGVYLKSYNINILNIYRAPKNKIHDFLNYFNEILIKYPNSVVVGDMNLDVLKDSNKIKSYKDMLQLNSFKIQNTNRKCIITRRNRNRGAIIDHLITQTDKKCEIKPYDCAITDHKMLKITVHLKTSKQGTKTIKEVEKTNYSKFLGCLQETNLESVQDLDQLVGAISMAKKKSTQMRHMRVINNNRWFNYTIQRQIKKRDKAYRKMVKFPDIEIYREQFNNIKKKTNYLIRKAKKEFVNRQLLGARTNVRQVWKLINSELYLGKREDLGIEKLKMGQDVITASQTIANCMNNYFVDIASRLHRSVTQRGSDAFGEVYVDKCIYLKKCSEEELDQIVKTLKNTSAAGEDGISVYDIRESYHLIKNKLLLLINKCIRTGTFPLTLKNNKVIPVFKKGSRYDMGNYRPIALTSTVAKILEKIVKKRMVEFFKLSDQQYGFQASSSTLGAACDLVESIIERTDSGYFVATVFIDLQKAFDTIDHQILLEKLHHLGVQGPALNLIEAFLVGRQQYVEVNKSKSDKKTVSCGIPQGSVLGPLLYLLYVESLSTLKISAKYYMFADDTVLMFYHRDIVQLQSEINKNLETFHRWLCGNKLVVNEEKTVYMLFSSKHREKDITNINVRINGKVVKRVQHYTYLGLTIDDKLNWGRHIDSIFNKLGGLIGCVKRINNLFCEKSKLMFYNAHINSVLSYLIAIWGNTTQFNINRVQRLQNKAVKNIFNLPYETSSATLYKRYPILPIKDLIKYNLCLLVYKIDNNLLKSNIKFEKNTIHSYETRNRDRYVLDRQVNTEYGRKRPSYAGAMFYNSLPRDLRLSQSYNIFKRQYKKMLLDR